MLLAVPNVSEGRDDTRIEVLAHAFSAPGVRLLDVHSDPDHHRSVFTIAGPPATLSSALRAGAEAAVTTIDLSADRGLHPHVGALDVAPVVHLSLAARGAACAEALVSAHDIALATDVPVFLYGILAGGRSRAQVRSGGLTALARRVQRGEMRPDFGPSQMHPTAGATLVGARPPLVAFNVELAAPATVKTARAVAAELREGGAGGLRGVRAIGLELASRDGAPQVSFNVEDPAATPLAQLIEATRARARIASAELVGLAPRVAFDGFPQDVPIPGFDPARHLIENALGL